MIVTNQSCQSLIARFVRRCHTIASVLTVREMSRSPLPYDLHANRSRPTNNFTMFFVDTRRRLLLQLRNRFIFQVTLFFHTVFCVAFHISTPGWNLVGVLVILIWGCLFHFCRRASLKDLSLGLSFLHRPLLIFDCVPGGLASFVVLDPGSLLTFANLSTSESSFPCDPPSWCRHCCEEELDFSTRTQTFPTMHSYTYVLAVVCLTMFVLRSDLTKDGCIPYCLWLILCHFAGRRSRGSLVHTFRCWKLEEFGCIHHVDWCVWTASSASPAVAGKRYTWCPELYLWRGCSLFHKFCFTSCVDFDTILTNHDSSVVNL